jgi:hypothetical protein
MKPYLFTLFSVLGLFGAAMGGPLDVRPAVPATAVAPSPVFSDEQFFIDLYGNYVDRTGDMKDCSCTHDHEKMNGFGGGVAFGYYIVPSYVILRGDFSFSSVQLANPEIAADILFRLPLLDGRLAPYAIVGGGIEANDGDHGFWHVGGGLEYRFTRFFAIFSEATYAWVENPDHNNNLTVKAGLRVSY